MNALRVHFLKHQERFLRFYYNILNIHRIQPVTSFGATIDVVEAFTGDNIMQYRDKMTSNVYTPQYSIQRFNETDAKTNSITSLPEEKFEKCLQELLTKNKDRQIEQIILHCLSIRRLISDPILKILLKHYSKVGKPEMIVILQKYFAKLLPNPYIRNGEFNHYLAKAQCLKGNSDKGLSLLRDSYKKNQNLRTVYRLIFRELIHDSVMNRSEASLVVFKKYVLEFSKEWEEHYPLVCFWHICWQSSWYSDQMLSDELWENSTVLQDIVKEKVAALCISALKSSFNEDAVVRLLQKLLKYKMMEEYANVLQVLFNYKSKLLYIDKESANTYNCWVVFKSLRGTSSKHLQDLNTFTVRNKDLRGCSEIIRNCEVLGITLPSDQQRKYIHMLIHGQPSEKQPIKPTKDFKLKF